MNTIELKAAQDGSIVRAYKNKPEFGYIQLMTESLTVGANQFMQNQVRSTLIKGSVKNLEAFVAAKATNNTVPGTLVVLEYTVDNLPNDVYKNFIARKNADGTEMDFNTAVEPYLKRVSNDGEYITKEGKMIVRITKWDPAGKESDVLVTGDGRNSVVTMTAPSASASEAILDEAEF
jgi:hypothetical protein